MEQSYTFFCLLLQLFLLQFCSAGEGDCYVKWVGTAGDIAKDTTFTAKLDLDQRYIKVEAESSFVDSLEKAVDAAIVSSRVVVGGIPETMEIDYELQADERDDAPWQRHTGLLLCVTSERTDNVLKINYDTFLEYGPLYSFHFNETRLKGSFGKIPGGSLRLKVDATRLGLAKDHFFTRPWPHTIVMEPLLPEIPSGWYELTLPPIENCQICDFCGGIVTPVELISRLENRTFTVSSKYHMELIVNGDSGLVVFGTASVDWSTRLFHFQLSDPSPSATDEICGLSANHLQIYFSLQLTGFDRAITHRKQYSFFRPSKIEQGGGEGTNFEGCLMFRFVSITSHGDNWKTHQFKISGYENVHFGEKFPERFVPRKDPITLQQLDDTSIAVLKELTGNKLPGILVSRKAFPDLKMASTINGSALAFIRNKVLELISNQNVIEICTAKLAFNPEIEMERTHSVRLKDDTGKTLTVSGTLIPRTNGETCVVISEWAFGYRNKEIALQSFMNAIEAQPTEYAVEILDLNGSSWACFDKIRNQELEKNYFDKLVLKFDCSKNLLRTQNLR